MRIYSRLFGLLLIIAFVGCTTKESLYMDVTPKDFQLQQNPFDTIYFKVFITSPTPVSRFIAKINKTNATKKTVLDTVLNSKKCNFEILYGVPLYYDTTQLTAEFIAQNVDGDEFNVLKSIQVCPKTQILKELAGCTFYSLKSSKNSGYNLVKNESLKPEFNLADIIDIKDTSVNETLSATWFSPKKGRFVRYNEFDYANATNLNVKSAFTSGTKLEMLSQIKTGDIILYGNEASTFYCVLKITSVTDQPGSEDDKYEFNLKK